MALEATIESDANACAENFWWSVHDEATQGDKPDLGKYALAGQLFVKQEVLIAQYLSRTIAEQSQQIAAYHFAEALRTYDAVADALKAGKDRPDLQNVLLTQFSEAYKALGYDEDVARHNCSWWINWAYSRLSQKKIDRADDVQVKTLFGIFYDRMQASIRDEHIAKYGFKSDAIIGLTAMFTTAIYEGHNTRKWELAQQMLSTYYELLFTKLAKIRRVTEDIAACARNSWWQAHDEHNYKAAAIQFAELESVLARYGGNKVDKIAAAAQFEAVLQTYDSFAQQLEAGQDTQSTEKVISEAMITVHEALGLNQQIAESVSNWWIFWAKSQCAEKKGDKESSEKLSALMFQHLTREHELKFGVKGDKALGLAHAVATPGYLAHTTGDWTKAHELLVIYYRELITGLAKA